MLDILSSSQIFQPTYVQVDQMLIRNTIDALEWSLEHTQELLSKHDAELGRTTYKNESWAKTLEKTIRLCQDCLKQLEKHK
jgi:hypothetical protein